MRRIAYLVGLKYVKTKEFEARGFSTEKKLKNQLKLGKIILIAITFLSTICVTSFHVKANSSISQNFIYQSERSEVLSPTQIKELNTLLNKFSASTDKKTSEKLNSQFAVYITDSLNGASIEDYAQNIFNTKQIGDVKHNKGVLLVLAVNDHKYRIHLGEGWKDTALTQSSIKDYAFGGSLTSMLKAENYNGAIQQIVQRTIGIAGQDISLVQPLQSYSKSYAAAKEEARKKDEELYTLGMKMIKNLIYLMSSIISIYVIFKIVKSVLELRMESYVSSGNHEDLSEITSNKNYSKSQKRKRVFETKQLLSLEFAFDEDLGNIPYTVQELAEKFAKSDYEEVSEENLRKFISELAEEQEKNKLEVARKQKIKYLMHERLRNEVDLPVSYYELIRAFTKTDLDATEENIDIFIDNFLKNYSLLKKKEKEQDLKPATHALKLTEMKPTTVFGDDIVKQLILFNILTTSYQSVHSTSHRTAPTSDHSYSSTDSSDFSSSFDSSSWSDFGGGGGFSDGGGASGGW